GESAVGLTYSVEWGLESKAVSIFECVTRRLGEGGESGWVSAETRKRGDQISWAKARLSGTFAPDCLNGAGDGCRIRQVPDPTEPSWQARGRQRAAQVPDQDQDPVQGRAHPV